MRKNAAAIVVNAVVKMTNIMKKEQLTMPLWVVVLNNDWW